MAFTHARNSNFQYLFFLAGKCHTADEAYRVLSDALEERLAALRLADAGELRRQIKRKQAEALLASDDEVQQLTGRADLIELEASEPITRACYDETKREIAFIKELIARLLPYRRFAHLPDHEAHQAAQREEWMLELMTRAENFVLSEGRIPHDHLEAARQHPDAAIILGHIERLRSPERQLIAKPRFIQALEQALPPRPEQPLLPDYGPIELRAIPSSS